MFLESKHLQTALYREIASQFKMLIIKIDGISMFKLANAIKIPFSASSPENKLKAKTLTSPATTKRFELGRFTNCLQRKQQLKPAVIGGNQFPWSKEPSFPA